MKLADAAMLVASLVLIWNFYRAQKNPMFSFDLFDLVMENGRLSKTSVAFVSTLFVTSWIMVRLTLDGKLTEGYFAAYAAAWIAPLVAKLFSPPPPAGTTTTTDSKTTTSTVDVKPQ
jgi:hypothetical protein